MTRGVARGVEQARFLDNVGPMDRLQQAPRPRRWSRPPRTRAAAPGSMMGAGMGMALGQQMGAMMAGTTAPASARGRRSRWRTATVARRPAVPRRHQRHRPPGRSPSTSSGSTSPPASSPRRRSSGPPGMPGWVPAQTVPALAGLFAAPPPLPPPPPPAAPPARRAHRCRTRRDLTSRPSPEPAMTDESGGAPPPLPPPVPSPGPPPLPPAGRPAAGTAQQEQQHQQPAAAAAAGQPAVHRADPHLPVPPVRRPTGVRPGEAAAGVPELRQRPADHRGRGPARRRARPTTRRRPPPRSRARARPVAEKEIVCQSCGGHTTFTGTSPPPAARTARPRSSATTCTTPRTGSRSTPYSRSRSTRRWRTNRSRAGSTAGWFAPSEFKKYKETGSLTSIYVAYFTFDATAITDYVGERGDHYTVEVGSGDDRHTETRTDWNRVSGRVVDTFDDLPILANNGLDDRQGRPLWSRGRPSRPNRSRPSTSPATCAAPTTTPSTTAWVRRSRSMQQHHRHLDPLRHRRRRAADQPASAPTGRTSRSSTCCCRSGC